MSELATSPAAETQTETQSLPGSTNWWRIGDAMVLALYSAVVLWTVGYHEKWADEAQAWLLARDLDLKTLWFHELRYEGSPGLWHTILYLAQHVFHMRYDSLGYLGAAFAIAGAAVLIFWAPFPRYIRWPLAFTYVMVYQYAVIARPYTLLPLLCFLAAIFFKDVKRPVRMTVVLVLLALLSFHGTVLAGCFGLLYLIEAVSSWHALDVTLRHRYVICAALMAVTLLFIFIILRPTPDIEEFAIKSGLAKLPEADRIQLSKITPTVKLTNIVSGAFLDSFLPSLLLLILLAAWSATRRRLLVFLLPVGAMIALYSVVHGAAHHHGTAFIAAITALWIAWPASGEHVVSSPNKAWATRGVIALLFCLCFVNIWDAGVVIKREYLYPYCGAEDAFKYLRSVGADQGPMFGMLFGVVGVQAYFDHNIFANVPTSYFHHGMPLTGTVLNLEELGRIQPEYVVAYSNDPDLMMKNGAPLLTTRGYEMVHFSDGYYLYKRAVFEREVYFIFRRRHSLGEQTPWQSGPEK
jgi:hypothetical protein